MKGMRSGLSAFCALVLVGAAQVGAQSVESIMRASERLELTEEQLESLEAIRRDLVEQRVAEMAEVTELRSQLQAGQIRRSDLMAALEDRRDAARARAEERRASIEAILTEEQTEALQQLRRSPRLRAERRRPGRRGFRDGRRGPRGPRAFRGGRDRRREP